MSSQPLAQDGAPHAAIDLDIAIDLLNTPESRFQIDFLNALTTTALFGFLLLVQLERRSRRDGLRRLDDASSEAHSNPPRATGPDARSGTGVLDVGTWMVLYWLLFCLLYLLKACTHLAVEESTLRMIDLAIRLLDVPSTFALTATVLAMVEQVQMPSGTQRGIATLARSSVVLACLVAVHEPLAIAHSATGAAGYMAGSLGLLAFTLAFGWAATRAWPALGPVGPPAAGSRGGGRRVLLARASVRDRFLGTLLGGYVVVNTVTALLQLDLAQAYLDQHRAIGAAAVLQNVLALGMKFGFLASMLGFLRSLDERTELDAQRHPIFFVEGPSKLREGREENAKVRIFDGESRVYRPNAEARRCLGDIDGERLDAVLRVEGPTPYPVRASLPRLNGGKWLRPHGYQEIVSWILDAPWARARVRLLPISEVGTIGLVPLHEAKAPAGELERYLAKNRKGIPLELAEILDDLHARIIAIQDSTIRLRSRSEEDLGHLNLDSVATDLMLWLGRADFSSEKQYAAKMRQLAREIQRPRDHTRDRALVGKDRVLLIALTELLTNALKAQAAVTGEGARVPTVVFLTDHETGGALIEVSNTYDSARQARVDEAKGRGLGIPSVAGWCLSQQWDFVVSTKDAVHTATIRIPPHD